MRSLASQDVPAMLSLQSLARFASSEALEKRYSPNQYGREKPLDSSLLWMRKSPYVEALVWVSLTPMHDAHITFDSTNE